MTLDRLVLWRHGETTYNATGRIQGHLDVPLSEVGQRQARTAAVEVATFAPNRVFCSDLRRAAETAAELTSRMTVPISYDKRLRETHVGEWQGLSRAEVESGWPGDWDTWQVDPTWAPPGGESRVDVSNRAVEVIAEIDTAHEGTVLVCAHGGLIKAVVGRLLGLAPELWPKLHGLANCHWTVLSRDVVDSPDDPGPPYGSWRLLAHNVGVPESYQVPEAADDFRGAGEG